MRFNGKSVSTGMITGILLVAVMEFVIVGCGKQNADSTKTSSSVIGGDRAADPAALFDTVQARVLRSDTVGLARILVDDSVFRRNVYPVSPAYDSVRQEVFDFVLSMHKANSNKGLRRLLYDASVVPGVVVLRLPIADSVKTRDGTLYTLAKSALGESGLQLYGSFLCRADGCQVVSYGPAGLKGPGSEGSSEGE